MLNRVPLRVQLLAALLALVTLGLLISGIAGTTALRRYMLDRADKQLTETAEAILRRPNRASGGPGRGPRSGIDPESEYFAEATDPTGRLVDRAPKAAGVDVPILPRLTLVEAKSRGSKPFTESRGNQTDLRVVAIPLYDESGTLTVAITLDDVESTVDRLTLIELIVGAGVLLLLGALGSAVVRSSLRPLVEVEATAEAIAAGDLTRRVPERDPRTEVGRLSRSLNSMLTQIESAFRAREISEAGAHESENRMRRFVADASHELRTPLTSIRGFAELYRQGAVRSPDDVDRAMKRIEDEATRMGLLVDDLLLLARLDQQRPLERRPVDLVGLAADSVHDATAAWPDREVRLQVLPTDEAPVVLGDEARLRQVLSNLVTNAVTHTPAGSVATVTVGTAADQAVLQVSDNGPGLTPEAAAKVFERFYRVDTARTRSAGGSGLGLSIVAALVAAHGGTVTVATEPGKGATFEVRIPLAPAVTRAVQEAERPEATRG